MPATERSLQITDAYRARLLRIRSTTQAGASRSWRSLLDLSDLERSFGRWLIGAVALTTQAQAAAAQLSDAYLSAYTTSELGEYVPPIGVDVAAFAGVTSYGRPIGEMLTPALYTVKAAIGDGRAGEEAVALGEHRAVRNVGFEADDAGRGALDDALSRSDYVRGWRRVTGLAPCGACIAAATGAIQDTEETMLVHPFCSCSKEPVISGASDDVRRPTGSETFYSMTEDEQNRLFEGRGGAAKADLIRSGDVALSDLITHDDQRSRQTVITETPLKDLRRG